MYPVIRMVKEAMLARRMPKLELFGTHVSHHICWPWDLDVWWELNNGRTLTLYDLGRIPLTVRLGLPAVLSRKGWGMTVAGSTVRYRRRVRVFHEVKMHSRLVGWDARFLYVEQSMWRGNEALNHVLLRQAITGPEGIVAPAHLIAALNGPEHAPALPAWIAGWIDADAKRPWPPMQD
ncbi:acyl-CoA thioesterase [Pararhodobacter sp. SW119]|uniref:acyl-CoA thioesterase n=1 Tax=Pararhodobacter sp. SW119 TaxID=2780075 RepID=UPI001AE08BCB|nr:acyl-CoA thioesterase [Pararhodobacter sp. SW119]